MGQIPLDWYLAITSELGALVDVILPKKSRRNKNRQMEGKAYRRRCRFDLPPSNQTRDPIPPASEAPTETTPIMSAKPKPLTESMELKQWLENLQSKKRAQNDIR